MDDREKGACRFLREKDCSAWEKWVGRGRDALDTVVFTTTGIVLATSVQFLSLTTALCSSKKKSILMIN